MKSRLSILVMLVIVLMELMIISCHQHPGSEPESDATLRSAQTENLVQRLHDRLNHYLQYKGNPDSLRWADYFLNRLETYAAEESWYLSARTKVSFLYATFVEMSDDSAAALYTQGVNSADNLLSGHPEIYRYIQTDTASLGSIDVSGISNETLEIVYWWTVNSLFRSAQLKAIRRLSLRNKIERSITLIRQVDPDYREGGPQRLTGLLHLFSPNGDLNQSRKSFQSAIDSNPSYLENSYFFGRYYGVFLQNRDVFLKNLSAVVKYSNNVDNQYYQLNLLVQNRVQQILTDEEKYFTSLSRTNSLNFSE